jgi:hypothetical protein
MHPSRPRPLAALGACVLAGLAGCATASGTATPPGSSAPPTTTTTVVMQTSPGVTGSTDLASSRENAGVVTPLASTPERAWTALVATFGALGIEPANVDVQRRFYGNQGVEPKNGRIAGIPTARLLNCGTTPTGVPLAQSYQVRLSVISSLEPAPEGSRLTTRVSGVAASRDGSSTQVPCGSTGRLEQRIAELMQQAQ